jgi:hypothetical protein
VNLTVGFEWARMESQMADRALFERSQRLLQAAKALSTGCYGRSWFRLNPAAVTSGLPILTALLR